MSGEKILGALRAANRGNIARVTIEGVEWTRDDMLEMLVANAVTKERERCAHAVNTHDQLLDALKDARAFMDDVRSQRGDCGVGILIKAADAAISKANGSA